MPNTGWLRAAWLCVLLGLGWGCSPAGAAPLPFAVRAWETDDGLPHNTVTSLATTEDGYLWVGTLNGLARFDGLAFTVFDGSNTPELEGGRIVFLRSDPAGGLWIGLESGAIVQWREGRFTPIPVGRTAPERRLVGAGRDAQGAAWFYTRTGELWRWQNNVLTPFLFEWGREDVPRFLAAETNGAVWVGAGSRMARLGLPPGGGTLEPRLEGEWRVQRLDFLLPSRHGGFWRLADGRVTRWRGGRPERELGPYPWRSAPVTSAAEDRLGHLVVGTLGLGVFWYRADGSVAWLKRQEGLVNEAVLAVCVDHENNLWVGTDGGGLARVRPQVFSTLEGAGAWPVQTVCHDGADGLWVGFNGAGLLHGTPQGARFYGRQEGLTRMQVWSVLRDSQGRVWAGTYGGGLLLWQTNHFIPAPLPAEIPVVVTALLEDRQRRLWIGGQGALVSWNGQAARRYQTNDGLSSAIITALAEDSRGTLYAGTYGGGLNVWRGGQWSAVRKSAGGLPSDEIAFLHGDTNQVLWVGTVSSGLARWDGRQWTRYTVREGLAGNALAYLVEDAQGFFWIGSSVGLMRIAKRDLDELAAGRLKVVPCRTYGKADGLPSRECTSGSQPAACQTPDGRLWFPTTRGLAVVNPAQLLPNTNPPPVRIEKLLVDGQTAALPPPGQPLRLPPRAQSRLEIHYASLNLGAPERARFRYQLEGHEQEMVEAGDSRIARYAALPPGQYRFVVTACNEDGVWNPTGAALVIVAPPPWWRTTWFLSAASVTLGGALVLTIRHFSTRRLRRQLERMRQQQALEKERARIARDLHDQLGANLTQIALLSEMAEADKNHPEDVAEHARQIAHTARETTRGLDEIVWTVNPANDTLEGLANYLCKYVHDYLTVAGIPCRLEVPSTFPAAAIAPEVRHHVYMTVKEAVTNVVRHAQARQVWLRIQVAGGKHLVIELEDDGRGLDPERLKNSTRNGLKNMQKRMAEAQGSAEFLPRPGGGTCVRLKCPLAA
ncbi:two-component regulator propeller domain-containing protein [Fontisphaera persica]|uniref:sensor histidine kinase n=1 Tax=Fontisphaera persica TaxID=2974023 RepID=UPI0024BFE293|nr:sensor histidine kinase [Fontisphaera persica]WCJ59078.1 two-component regulator propeller domain-containing protein [Fontisphaera persica]